MLKIHKVPYEIFSSFIYRTPVFSLNTLKSIPELADNLEILNDGLFLEALYLASPELHSEAIKIIQGNYPEGNTLKLKISILKYLLRMCTRCTPFGLFAGCGIGKVGEESDIVLLSSDKFKSNTRLDMDYLCAFMHDLGNVDAIKNHIRFFPNTSIYKSGDNLRYIEYYYVKNRRTYVITEVERSGYLEKILKEAVNGKTLKELEGLISEEDFTREEVREYINDLIKNQILVSDLEPAVTGPELFDQLLFKMQGVDAYDISSQLNNLNISLKDIDNHPIGRSVKIYEDIKKQLNHFQTKFNDKYIFQSDLFVENDRSIISKAIVDIATKAISVFNRLTNNSENPLLKKFREDFFKRYEEQEVPLSEALDIETGIGFGRNNGYAGDVAPLLETINFQGTRLIPGQSIEMRATQNLLMKKYEDYLKSTSAEEIEITENDLFGFNENWNDLPDTFSSLITVIRTEKSPQGPLILTEFAGGSSAAKLLGRFCYLDNRIHKSVEEIVSREHLLKQHRIIAEIAHLPENHVGNILVRPHLRHYEIPYLSNSMMNRNRTIPLTDLLVSTPNGRYIKLRSRRLNKEIIPVLTNAHNYNANALPVYHFLSLFQSYGLREAIGFGWGPLLREKPFLPRVRYGNAILSPAIWNITRGEINNIPCITDRNFYREVSEFKRRRKIPDKVLLVRGDNKLLIDFDHLLSVQMLFAEVKGADFKLEEFLLEEEYSLVRRSGEIFANEVILCFYKNNTLNENTGTTKVHYRR
ncbi:MAG: lantibiotic dehydratase family protein [Mangrovibacterium sp.]